MITENLVCIIQRGKPKSTMLADAVMSGTMGDSRTFYGDEGMLKLTEDETPVIIGTHPTTVDYLHEFAKRNRPYIVIDNGYLKGYTEGGYFRATTNAMQWIGGCGNEYGRKTTERGNAKKRFHALNMDLMKEWRAPTETGHILLAVQSPIWFEMMGISMDQWLNITTRRIRNRTDREIIIRHKPLKGTPVQPSLEEHFKNCAAVVGLSSCTMIKAILEGIQVFPTNTCAATVFSTNNLGDIDYVQPPRRLGALYDLAANQWTMDEIASGLMLEALIERYEDKFYELA